MGPTLGVEVGRRATGVRRSGRASPQDGVPKEASMNARTRFALVAGSALAVGYVAGKGSGSKVEAAPVETNAQYTTQSADGRTLYVWRVQNGVAELLTEHALEAGSGKTLLA